MRRQTPYMWVSQLVSPSLVLVSHFVGLEALCAFAQLAYLSLPSPLIRILVFFDLSLL